MTSNNPIPQSTEETIDLLELFFTLWNRKWWFVLSGGLCIVVALLYLKRTAPVYAINAVVAVTEDKGKIPGGKAISRWPICSV